jgi:homoserine O-acetyltransferase
VLPWVASLHRNALGSALHPHDFLYQSWAYDAHDVGATPGFGGDTDAALAAIRACALILTPPLDLYNPVECGVDVARKIPGARHVVIPSLQGHQAANTAHSADVEFLNRTIGEFIDGRGAGAKSGFQADLWGPISMISWKRHADTTLPGKLSFPSLPWLHP